MKRKKWLGEGEGPQIEDYEKLIKYLANKYQYTTGVEFEDLVSEGYIVFYKAKQDFDSRKASFTTYLWHRLTYKYRSIRYYGIGSKKIKLPEKVISPESIESSVFIRQVYDALSAEAKEVVELIFTSPAEVLELLGVKSLSRSSITEFLVKERGWKHLVVCSVFQEIKKQLRFD